VLSFAPGETLKTVRVALDDDSSAEGNEGFYLFLNNPTNATIGTGSAVATIIDIEVTVGTPAISISDPVVDEGADEAVFVLALDRPSTSAVSVDYATAAGSAGGSDFATLSGTVIFGAGEMIKTVRVAIADDALAEDAEQFDLVLSNPVNANLSVPRGVTV
jgi:hypothetical protein